MAASSSSGAPGYLKKYERAGLSLDELEEMKEAFDLFDLKGTGRIDPQELYQTVQSLG